MNTPKYPVGFTFRNRNSPLTDLTVLEVTPVHDTFRYVIVKNGETWSICNEAEMDSEVFPAIPEADRETTAIVAQSNIACCATVVWADCAFTAMYMSDAKGCALVYWRTSHPVTMNMKEAYVKFKPQLDTLFRDIFRGRVAASDYVRKPPFLMKCDG